MSGISTFVKEQPEGPVLMESVEVDGRKCQACVRCANCGEMFHSQEEPMWVRPKNHSRANGNNSGKVPVHVMCALAANVGAVQDAEFDKEFARRKLEGAPLPDFRRRMR